MSNDGYVKSIFFLICISLTCIAYANESLSENPKVDQEVRDNLETKDKTHVLIHFNPFVPSSEINSTADIARLNSASEVYELTSFGIVAAEIDLSTINQIAEEKSVHRVTVDPIGQVTMPEAEPFINADILQASPYSLSGSGITVAIVDTGIDEFHPDMVGHISSTRLCRCRISPTCCSSPSDITDDEGHGTAMAGTILRPNDGIAPSVEVIPIKIFNEVGAGFLGDFLKVLQEIVKNPNWGINIINTSFRFGSGTTGAGSLFSTECSGQINFRAVAQAINTLRNRGTIVVSGAGNDYSPTLMGGPACIAQTISVSGHMDVNGTSLFCSSPISTQEIPCYANHNQITDIVAPSSFITSSEAGGTEFTDEGVSYSTAITSGCVALMMEAKPSASVSEITEAITKGTYQFVPSFDPSVNSKLYPQLDCLAAVDWLQNDRSDVEAVVFHDTTANEVSLSIKVNGERSSTDLHLNWRTGSVSPYTGGSMIGSLHPDCTILPFSIGAFTDGTCVFSEAQLGETIEIARFDVSNLTPSPYASVVYSIDIISSTRIDHVSSNNFDSESFSGGPPSS